MVWNRGGFKCVVLKDSLKLGGGKPAKENNSYVEVGLFFSCKYFSCALFFWFI
jgi:hypothetical protein